MKLFRLHNICCLARPGQNSKVMVRSEFCAISRVKYHALALSIIFTDTCSGQFLLLICEINLHDKHQEIVFTKGQIEKCSALIFILGEEQYIAVAFKALYDKLLRSNLFC